MNTTPIATQRLIPSLQPFYLVFRNLCYPAGSWTGDIYALRRALKKAGFIPTAYDGTIITQRLNSLQRRGFLAFTTSKHSHKRVTWTITLTRDGEEVKQTPTK